jgi:hypothetical protein
MLREIMSDAFNWAPFLFRHEQTATVTIAASTGIGNCPADFMSPGTQTRVLYNQGSRPVPLNYKPEGDFLAWSAMQSSTGSPQWYTWLNYINQGTRRLAVWPAPSSNGTAIIKSYNKKCAEPIDFPQKPTITPFTGALTGTYKWKCTFEWANGETEGGFESESTVLATQSATIQVPVPLDVSPITGVNIYRTVAGGTTFFLVNTVTTVTVPDSVIFVDNESVIQYTDSTTDTDLGAICPFPIDAYSGTEQFPDDFHEMVLFEGTKAKAMETQGDQRDMQFWALFRKNTKRMWAETKPGQNVAYSMPAYGQGEWGVDARSRIPFA